MDFDLSIEHQEFRTSVRGFSEKVIKPKAHHLDEHEEFSLETLQAMAAQGLLGINAPPQYGGGGKDYLSYILAVEELARIDGSHAATVAAANSLGIGPILHFGNQQQKDKYLPKLCSGEGLWAFGLTEPGAGSDAGAAATTAELDGDEWVINGKKVFITNASSPVTKGVTVMARTGTRDDGRPELSCILVEHGAKGFEAKPIRGKMMWRASNTGALFF
jgi:short/branched chain acyl-CoA dehydrogenase